MQLRSLLGHKFGLLLSQPCCLRDLSWGIRTVPISPILRVPLGGHRLATHTAAVDLTFRYCVLVLASLPVLPLCNTGREGARCATGGGI
jgi:hypothetical protein